MECVKALLAAGADPSTATAPQHSALGWTAWYGDKELATVLLEAGANPDADAGFGRTPAQLAVARGWHDLAQLFTDKDVP